MFSKYFLKLKGKSEMLDYNNIILFVNLLLVLMLFSDFINIKRENYFNDGDNININKDEELTKPEKFYRDWECYLEEIKPQKPDENSTVEDVQAWNDWIEKQCELNEYKTLYSAWKYHLKDSVKWEDMLKDYKRKYKNK